MPIHNVSSTHHDHSCVICGAAEQQRPHEKIERVTAPDGSVLLVIECAAGHRECFNNALTAEEETSPTRDEASREQVRNVRALHKHLGLPLVEERSRAQ